MYTGYFNLKKEPFRITPDPEFLYLSPSHKEALASVIYGVQQRKGFIAIVGEVGVGKTTILRAFLAKADERQLKVIYIFNAGMTFKTLLLTIYDNLGQSVESDDVTEMLNQLYHVLIREYQKGINVVVIIDEAQNMPLKTLESLRMLSNLETATDKLIQVVFSGQPEFERLLASFELRQLRQRIAIKSTIRPLTREESLAYIKHRLAKASGGSSSIFAERTLSQLVRMAGGIPRTINIICDNCLVTTYGHQQKRVEPPILKEICADLGLCRSPYSERGFMFLLLALVIVSCAWVLANRPWQVEAKSNGNAFPQAGRGAPAQVTQPDSASTLPEIRSKGVTAAEAINDKQPASAERSRLVRKGDTLANLVTQQYGMVNSELLQLVKRNNPGMTDPNKIIEGQKILFPSRDQ